MGSNSGFMMVDERKSRSGHGKSLGEVYTFDEAPAKLGVSTFLSTWIKGTNFYSKAGRVYRFSDEDILSIWESMRAVSRSGSETRYPPKTSSGRKPRLTNPSPLAKLFTGRPRKRSSAQSQADDDPNA